MHFTTRDLTGLAAGLFLSAVGALSAADAPAPNASAAKPKGAASNHGLPEGVQQLHIGDAAPNFSLPGIDGKRYSLADFKDAKVLVVAFMSNHCPESQAAEGRLKKLAADLAGQGLALVAINPNNPDALRPDELGYSQYNDSFDEMKLYARQQHWTFPYLYDGETQGVAKAYGCLATPHIFIFDAQRKLRYQGALDDSRYADPATVQHTYARDAATALLAGQPVPVETTRPHGCSTKWITKKTLVAQDDEKWDNFPVEVQSIDAAGVAALRKNGTKKVRLFNVWATWCGPCVAEFPELVKTARKFGLRDFELITISMNGPEEADEVKAFLVKKHAGLPPRLKPSLEAEGRATNSYIFKGANQDALIKALDPEWPGPIPHTLVVAPDGAVIYRCNGPVNGDELRAKILEAMGHYYKPEQAAR